jgi:hypothetical protein
MPVLPEVGSTITEPGLIRPSRSAASSMAKQIRSLTEPPGLSCSHLANTRALPGLSAHGTRTSGVLPMSSRMLSMIGPDMVVLQMAYT